MKKTKLSTSLFALAAVALLAGVAPAQIMPPVVLDTVSVTGTVTENSGMLPVWIPLEGAMIVAYEIPNIYLEPNAPIVIQVPLDTAYADARGNYAFNDLVVDAFALYLVASYPGYFDSTAVISLPAREDPVTVNFALNKIAANRLCVVTGKVWGSAGGTLPAFSPLEGALVTLFQNGLIVPLGLFDQYSDETGRDGSYEVLVPVDSAAMFTIIVSKTGYTTYIDSLKLAPGDTVPVEDIYLRLSAPSVQQGVSRPEAFAVRAFPNPSAAGVTVWAGGSELPNGVTMTVYDVRGKQVAGPLSPGARGFVWNGRAARGTYFAVVSDHAKVLGRAKIFLK